MKTRYIKYIIAVLLFIPSVGAVAQNQYETDPKTLEEFLKFQYDNMVYVEGGTYLKGEGQVPTTVGSFYCCRYETVKGLYRLVMDLSVDEDERMRAMCGPNWTTIQTFISKLNTLTGKRYRLLTDSEWEYAARGGNKSKGYLYAGSNNIDDVAWYMENLNHWTLRVGTKQPNELGLYDMSGNVEEWCLDSVSENVNAKRRTPVVDVDSLPDPPDFGIHRYVRGGGFMSDAEGCTVYAHYGQASDWGMPTIGFRLAMDVDEYGMKAPKFRIGLKTGDGNSEIEHDVDYISYNTQIKKFILPSTDEEGNEKNNEVDIAQVDYITRAPISSIRIPQGTNTDNIVVLGDNDSIQISGDGTFVSDANALIAYNNDNLMYLNISPGRYAGQKIALNGIETAASMLTMLFPDAYQNMSLKNFTLFKLALAQLEETKALGNAIDNTVAAKGYFDMSDIQNEYVAVVARLIQLGGVDSNNTVNSSLHRAPREPSFYIWNDPSFPPQRTQKAYGDGYRVELNKSTWFPNGTDTITRPVWQCDFTVYNLRRYCYMFVMKGFLGSDGLGYASSSDIADMFRYIVKPQGVASFMDFGSISDIGEMKFLTEPIETIKDADFSKLEKMFKETIPLWGSILKGESYDTTWDTVEKKGIELNYVEGENQLLVVGPQYHFLMKFYNTYMKIILPTIKLYKGFKKLDFDTTPKTEDKDKKEINIWDVLFVEYFEDLKWSEPDFYLELERKISDGTPADEFLSDMGEKFIKSYLDFIFKKGDEVIAYFTLQKYEEDNIKSLTKRMPVVKEIQQIFKLIELIYKAGDIILGSLDLNYKGDTFNMQFDFNQPQGGIDPIPGEDL